MPFFRKKPVMIEAHKLTAQNYQSVKIWCKSLVGRCAEYGDEGKEISPCYIVIKTLEGNMRANQGDYIIKGIHGEFYPCKEEIFLQSYEEV